jgi:ArsR family transcriptional regulator
VATGKTPLTVCHHLKVLRGAGLVEAERYRYWTSYRLRPEALDALADQLWLLARTSPAAVACRTLAPATTHRGRAEDVGRDR